jgi:predicted ATPase/DNA-binding SARP family transcriptional activator
MGALESSARLKLILLGGFQARLDSGAALVLPTRKAQALVAYLALPPGRSHPRESLAALLWGDMPEAQGRSNLRQALSRIRKALPDAIQSSAMFDGPTVFLDPALVDVDVARFERLAADGRPTALEDAVFLYRGDLLAGLTISERRFESWLISERERLREIALDALTHLLGHQQQTGAVEPAILTGLRLLALDPLQEAVHRAVMRLYMRAGRREAALRQYRHCLTALAAEVGMPPDPETRRLHEQILHWRPRRSARERGPEADLASTAPAPDIVSLAGRALTEPPTSTNVPPAISELIGRRHALEEVAELVAAHRLVTLTGSGGIGKTRLALEVARQILPGYADGVWLAELAPLIDPELVAITVAGALGLKLPPGAESPEGVAHVIGDRHVLILLDNCEHVIEAAARTAEILLRISPHVRLLATSREPLRAPGEHVYRVLSLELPPEATHEQEAALASPAVTLFATRAQAMNQDFSLDSRGVILAGSICRRLDGIPLAIELAAARAPALGLEGLATRLDDRFRLLTGGHRTALPRHQTLRATLDWSHDLLSDQERTVLRRVAAFASGFTLEAAEAVAGDAEVGHGAVGDAIVNLAAKSLLAVDVTGPAPRYRLLETTRAYALEKLGQSGELDRVARRHAEYYRSRFERAEHERATLSTAGWLAAYGPLIDNVRAALDWAFSPTGDPAIGVALTAAAVPLWSQQSLLVESRGRAERALASLVSGAGHDRSYEIRLWAALGESLMHTKGPAPDTIAAWTTVLETAETLDDADYRLRALWGLWHARITRGECHEALELAERFRDEVTRSAGPADRPLGERMIGASLHYLGDQAGARRHLEAMLAGHVDTARQSHTIRFQYDQKGAVHMVLARLLWLQGFPEQAMRTAEANIEDAHTVGHGLSMAGALETACLVSIWSGDVAAAGRWVAALLDYTRRHALPVRHRGARCFHGVLLLQRGETRAGLQELQAVLHELRESCCVPYGQVTLAALALGLGRARQTREAVAVIDDALRGAENNGERWYMGELLRVRAELSLLEGGPDSDVLAEAHLQRGLRWTREQGVLGLELRCATTLARLWHRLGRARAARDLLRPVHDRFTEGFATADLRAAGSLLRALQPVGESQPRE